MDHSRILVVDDDPLIRGSLYEMLRARHYEVEMASDGAEAMGQLERRPFHLVIADWKMPQVDGMNLLGHIKNRYPQVSVILITGFGNISCAVNAIRQGAFDYLTKPIQPEELESVIQRALNTPTDERETLEDPFSGIIGKHPSIQELLSMVRAVAESPATVLLEGESGTGKRVIAQAIHRCDPKRNRHSFVEISCGALPETLLESELFGHVRGAYTGAIRDRQGRFELANGGTILLDEIDAFTPALQVKLLRVIQDRLYERVGDTRTMRADVRIVAATNRNLSELVKQGKFREDLYYRLNVIQLRVPPLRERKSDLPLLVTHFIARSCRAMGKNLVGLTDAALQIVMDYQWPGNIRELENVMERAVVLAKHSKVDVDDLPEALRSGNGLIPTMTAQEQSQELPGSLDENGIHLKDALKLPEREVILKVLAEVRWNRTEAAKRLGIHRSTLYHKIRKLGIHHSYSN
ncbi:MAG: sigma-54-dependent Fis family transcriptional regulator [Candidatus Omnitrophica bacterium]|nr:sigma-54-dependent Fis family transcriptional regulator [Candidatus Omnitrophota bacterium]MBI3009383.1 sigma-54-dependent Fis family transcriptional regulator [Candidatus Omnitrophota bacterium]